jgi:hypothetical protein
MKSAKTRVHELILATAIAPVPQVRVRSLDANLGSLYPEGIQV